MLTATQYRVNFTQHLVKQQPDGRSMYAKIATIADRLGGIIQTHGGEHNVGYIDFVEPNPAGISAEKAAKIFIGASERNAILNELSTIDKGEIKIPEDDVIIRYDEEKKKTAKE